MKEIYERLEALFVFTMLAVLLGLSWAAVSVVLGVSLGIARRAMNWVM